jgi:hypothetical protein
MHKIKTLFNIFPKSGTHLLLLHRQDLDKKDHVHMFVKGEFQEPKYYCDEIWKREYSSFTGHIPYSDEVYKFLREKDYRIVFIYRDLRDVAVSLADHAISGKGDLGVKALENRPWEIADILSECIRIIGDWWKRYSGWLTVSDTLYRYEELRGAALLLGKEEEALTFNRANVGEWKRRFEQKHIDLAHKLFREYYDMG